MRLAFLHTSNFHIRGDRPGSLDCWLLTDAGESHIGTGKYWEVRGYSSRLMVFLTFEPLASGMTRTNPGLLPCHCVLGTELMVPSSVRFKVVTVPWRLAQQRLQACQVQGPTLHPGRMYQNTPETE